MTLFINLGIFFITCYFIKSLYNYVFKLGGINISIGNNYSFKRIKYNFNHSIIEDLKVVAMNSVDVIPNNPFFKGENLNNKIATIIYYKNKPVCFNVMFNFKYNNLNCLHLGLVLVDKNHRKNSFQKTCSIINVVCYFIENIFDTIYITDVGRSPSGLQSFNNFLKNSYPNLIFSNNVNNDIYKEICSYFVDTFKKDVQISDNAELDLNTFVIKNSNDIYGGATYLISNNSSTYSRNNIYNEYFQKLNSTDEVISIGKLSLFHLIKFRLFSYFS